MRPARVCTALAWAALAAAPGAGQVPAPGVLDAPSGAPLDVVRDVGIDQHLDRQLPLGLRFVDHAGREIELGDCFGERPVVLALVYYECPMLCTQVLNGLVKALRPLPLEAGRDFDVVTVSIDPAETPELAAKKRAAYVEAWGHPGAAEAWHALVGREEDLRALADVIGFRYRYDPATGEYAHAAGIFVATPDGRLARYFYGIEYAPRDLRLGLVEASNGEIGSLADAFLMLCYHYDPLTGKYGFAIMTLIRVLGVLTCLAIGGFMTVSLRSERRRRRAFVEAQAR